MRKPITQYEMLLYRINKNRINEIETDLQLDYKPITLKNLDEVVSLRNGTRKVEFEKLVKQSLSYGIAAYCNGEIVGYGWLKKPKCYDKFFKIEKSQAYLASFFVSPNYRGHSIYPSLIQKLIKESSIFLSVNDFDIAIDRKNIPSIKGVQKLGFKLERKLKMYRVLKVTIPKYKI